MTRPITLKRGGNAERVELHDDLVAQADGAMDVLDREQIDAAMMRFRVINTSRAGCVLSNGHIVSADATGNLRILGTARGTEPLERRLHTGEVFELAVDSSEQMAVTTGSDGRMVVSRLSTLETVMEAETAWGVRGAAFSADGLNIAAAPARHSEGNIQEGTVALWSIPSGEEVRQLEGHTNWVIGIEFTTDDNRLATLSVDETLQVWDRQTGVCKLVIDFSDIGPASQMNVISNDERVVIGHNDGSVSCWLLRDGRLAWNRQVAGDEIIAVIETPAEVLLVANRANSELLMLHQSTGETLGRLPCRLGPLRVVRQLTGSAPLQVIGENAASCLWQTRIMQADSSGAAD